MKTDAAQQVMSISIAIAATVWSAWVVHQALQADDGGPSIGGDLRCGAGVHPADRRRGNVAEAEINGSLA
jgi:hypothetical protein